MGDGDTAIPYEVQMALDTYTDDYNEMCNYTGYYSNLSFYQQEHFSFNMDYKRLNITLSLYDSINKMLFRTDILDLVEKVYAMSKTGGYNFPGIIEMEILWFMLLGILVLVFLVLVLSVVLTLVRALFTAGKVRECYQKIDPSNSIIRSFLGGLMSLGTVIVLTSTLLGLLGNMQYKTIKLGWEDFAEDTRDYLIKYVRNVTADMETISTVEMIYMEDKIEALLYKYQGLAATQVKAAEFPRANDYKYTSEVMDDSIEDLQHYVEMIERLLDESWELADGASNDITACYEAIKSYCNFPFLFFNTWKCDNMEPYKLIAENVFPLDQEAYQLSTYKSESLSAVTDELAELTGLGISDFILNNWQLWNTTIEDIMEHTHSTRVHLTDNFQGLRGWYSSSFKRADAFLRKFEYRLDRMMPRVSNDYKDGSPFNAIVKYESFGISVMFSFSTGFAVLCCALFMLGVATSDDQVLPTERSNASHFVAKGMEISLGIMFLLNIVTLIVAIVHYVPSTVLSRTCYEVNVLEKNPFRMWDANILQPHSIISTALGDTTSNVTFKGFLDDCKEGKSLHDALNLTNVWNLDKYFNIYDFLPYKRSLMDSELNPHEHWYVTYFSDDQLAAIYRAGNITSAGNESALNRITDILVTISNRGLVKLPTEQFGNFSEAAATAGETYNDEDNKIKRALATSCNLNLLLDTQHTIKANFEEVSDIITSTITQGFYTYADHLANLVEWNELIFKKSAQVFKSKMMECVSLMDDEVRCFGQIARHQYSKIIGRCRPLYNIYEAVNNFVCARTANAAGLLMLACLINCVVLTFFSVSIQCLIPHFKRMTKLHPDDQLKLERSQVVKLNAVEETDM